MIGKEEKRIRGGGEGRIKGSKKGEACNLLTAVVSISYQLLLVVVLSMSLKPLNKMYVST